MSEKPALPGRHANGRFGPGNPGRRAGARGRLSHRAVMAILEDFQSHRGAVLDRMRIYHAPAYFAAMQRLLDRQLEVEVESFDEYSDDEVAHTYRLARSALNETANPRTALIELESALLNRSCLDPVT